MDINYSDYVKILPDGTLKHASPVLDTGTATYDHPSVRLLNRLGYFRYVQAEEPTEDLDGKKVIDHGLQVVTDGDEKVVKHVWKVLDIVDLGKPDDADGYEFIRDYWEETDTQYIHRYVIVELIDNPPELEDGQVIVSDRWILDEASLKKTRVYEVRVKVDEAPELEEGQQVVAEWWHDTGIEYIHQYIVRFVVDNPPELEEGQEIFEEWWDDDGVTRTHRYDLRKVIDTPPVLEDGQQIIEDWWEDDGETRTHQYAVRKVIDNPPELEDGQQILEDWWDDDGTTRTHVYIVRRVVDNPPELAENQFVKEDWWDDDGSTKIHIYDVWTNIDERPVVNEENQRLMDLGWSENEEAKTNVHNYKVIDILDNPPEEAAEFGYHWEKTSEEEVDDHTIRYVYSQVEDPPPPSLTISNMYFELEMARRGLLERLDEIIDSIQVPLDADGHTIAARRLYDRAVEFKTDNAYFSQFFKDGCQALGLTSADGWEILYESQPKD